VTRRLSIALLALLCTMPALAGASKKVAKKSAARGRTVVAKPVAAKPDLHGIDRTCATAFNRGDIAVARRDCSDLKPASDPVAVYWRLRLAEDPNDLRRGLCASSLKGIEPDGRLLLLAGRYQFSRGEAKELSDLVALADRKKVKGREIDTLRRLGTGG